MKTSVILTILLGALLVYPLLASPIHDAAQLGDLSNLERLCLPGVAVDEADTKTGLTPWQVACIHGRQEAAAFLAKAGADVQRPFPAPERVLNSVIAAEVSGETPGYAVLVSRDGKILWEAGFGMANL
ncbi:MAG: hypothetical protein ACAI34_23410, partial [Verrucomicrobium sp.]